jgi:required for meiotic nuclear division protein 1
MEDRDLRLVDSERVQATAWFLGQRIETRGFDEGKPLAESPLTVSVDEGGYAMLFRFGAVVFIDSNQTAQEAFVRRLAPRVVGPFESPETERLEIVARADRDGRLESDGCLSIAELSLERLQIVAHILVKSTVLAHYEYRIGRVFDSLEPLAVDMQRGRSRRIPARSLLRQIGSVLSAETLTVGRVEITEKPELTWDRPDLDRLYERLSAEYELRERDRALARKLELISRTSETMLELMQNRRMLHVELYIVLLIAVEIVIMVYDMFLAH